MRKFLLPIVVVLAGSLTACDFPFAESAQLQIGNSSKNQGSTNLVALFLVKKDNLQSQLRGEIYPIALYVNGGYVDVSNDVTREVRDNFSENILLRNIQSKSFLNAIKNFTVINQDQKLGEFTVNKLALSQFACTSMITGQGDFSGEASLQQIYEAIPDDRSGGFNGSIGKKQFDESWRWTIATSQYSSEKTAQPKLSQADETQYRKDLLDAGKTLIAQHPEAKQENVRGAETLEQFSVVDLNRDGRPEVFGIVRKGNPDQLSDRSPIAYANLWLDYTNGQPRVLSSQVQVNRFSSKPPYTLMDTIDLDNNGVEEVMVQHQGYESFNFGIYEYRNNQLTEVFNGAGYGC